MFTIGRIIIGYTTFFCFITNIMIAYRLLSKMSSPQTAKEALRREIKSKISNLSLEEKQKQSKRVADKLFKLPVFASSGRVSLYLSTENEIDTTNILRHLLEGGKKCYVPRYNRNSMEMVRVLSMADYDSLPLTKWNIKQPKIGEDRENALKSGGLDLILVPGVAFTKDGARCGHGKGFYDTYLSTINQETSPVTIGLAFKEQILPELPLTQSDYKLDMVLYDN